MSKEIWRKSRDLNEGPGGFDLYRTDSRFDPDMHSLGVPGGPERNEDGILWVGRDIEGLTRRTLTIEWLDGPGSKLVAKVPVLTESGEQSNILLTPASAAKVAAEAGLDCVVEDDAQEFVGALLDMLIQYPAEDEPQDCQECPMESYVVVRREICEMDYTVKARNPDEACRKVKAGEGKPVDDFRPTMLDNPVGPSVEHPWEVTDKGGEGCNVWVETTEERESLEEKYASPHRCGIPTCTRCV